MMHEYLTIGILCAIIALTVGWMFLTSKSHYLIKCIAATIVLSLTLYNWTLFTSIMAYPINELPPNKTYVMGAIPIRTKHITYLWIVDPKDADKGPKSYIIPYRAKETQKLQEAMEKAKQKGGLVVYHRPKNGQGQGGEGDDEGDDEGGVDGQGKAGQGKTGKGKRGGAGNDTTGFTDDSDGDQFTIESSLPKKD